MNKFLTPVDFTGLEAINYRFQVLATAPSMTGRGRAYYDSAIDTLRVHNGTDWINLDPSKVANGYIPLAKVAGAAPIASPSFTGQVTTPAGSTSQAGGLKLTAGAHKTTTDASDSGSIEYNGTTLSFIDSTGARRVLGVSGAGIQSVSLTEPSSGFTITPGGTSNDPTFTFALSGDLAAIEELATTGIVRRTGADTWTAGAAVSLVTEVTGTLPVTNGGTGVTTSTGTGANVHAASPALTGSPTSPTAAADTNTTQIATTAFVLAQASAATPSPLGTAAAGSATRWARGDHVHAMPRLDQVAVPTDSVNFNEQRGINLADPVNAQDAVNKRYADSLIEGLVWKDEVNAATLANIANLAGGAPSIVDGVTLVLGDRVLVMSQTNEAQNGIYVVSTLGTGANGTWARSSDANTSAKLAHAAVVVNGGSSEKGKRYTTSFAREDVIGTSPVTWALFNGGSSIEGSTSIDITADVASVIVSPAGGLAVSGTGVGIDTAVVVRKYAQAVGAGTSVVITHGLNTLDVTVQVYEVSSGATVFCDVARTSVNAVTLGFAIAVASGDYRVVVHG